MAGVSGMSFEQAMQRLEQVVAELERGELTLEDSMRLFKEGVMLYRLCSRMLAEAETQIQKLLESSDGEPLLEPFDIDIAK